MSLTLRPNIIIITIFIFLATLPGCTDDPALPPPAEDFEINLISPYHTECPDAPFTVRVEANKPLQRVEFTIDGETVATVFEAPFAYLWNISLWADEEYHFLIANGFDTEGHSDSQGNVAFSIPTTVDGILINPPANSGVPNPTETALHWRSSPGALNYEVFLSLHPDFSSISNTAITPDTALTMSITEQQWQYWRVRPLFDEGTWGHWSESAAFYGGVVFDRTYIKPGSNNSFGTAVQPMPDGGYITAGMHNAYPLAYRFDQMGELLWTFAPYVEGRYNDVVATEDGGCLLVGKAQFYGYSNLQLTRLDAQGSELWSNPNYGTDSTDEGFSICRCSGGGYVAAGRCEGLLWLLRIDEQGWLIWQNTYGNGEVSTVLEQSDGGFIFTGKTSPHDFVLVGTDSSGHEKWRTVLNGGELPLGSPGIGLVETDSGYTALDTHGQLHRFDENGQFLTYASLGYGDYSALETTQDGGFVISVNNDLLGLDGDFQELWLSPQNGAATDIHQTDDSGFIITGEFNHSLWLLKTNAEGVSSPPETRANPGYH